MFQEPCFLKILTWLITKSVSYSKLFKRKHEANSLYIWQSVLPIITFFSRVYVRRLKFSDIFGRKHDRKMNLSVVLFVRCTGYNHCKSFDFSIDWFLNYYNQKRLLSNINFLCSTSIWTCRISNISFDFPGQLCLPEEKQGRKWLPKYRGASSNEGSNAACAFYSA